MFRRPCGSGKPLIADGSVNEGSSSEKQGGAVTVNNVRNLCTSCSFIHTVRHGQDRSL